MKVLIGPFSIDTELDAEILEAFNGQRNKSEYFRQRMRVRTDAVMQGIAQDVQEIKRMLQDGIIVQTKDSTSANDQLIHLCDKALSGLGAE